MQTVSTTFVDPDAVHERAVKWKAEGYKNIRITPTTEERLVSGSVTQQRVFILTAYKMDGKE